MRGEPLHPPDEGKMETLTAEAMRSAWSDLTETTALGHFGVELVDIDDTRCVLRMEIRPSARQPMGLLHGGVSLLLAESAASMHSCVGTELARFQPVGIEVNGSHVGSARDGHVRVVAERIRRGRTLVVHEVRVHHEESGRLLCVARVTNLLRPTGEG